MVRQREALKVIEETLQELERKDGSLIGAVQKLYRASVILGDEDLSIWCAIQLGDPKYTKPLRELCSHLTSHSDFSPQGKSEYAKKTTQIQQKLIQAGLKIEVHHPDNEIQILGFEAGGDYRGIAFIDERIAAITKMDKGNDGTYYTANLTASRSYIQTKAYKLASDIYDKIKFAGMVHDNFDILREAVDDQLLDLKPELAEQLMLAFRSVSSSSSEEWSQALTTCRRLIEGLADALYPASSAKTTTGRALGQTQYINRLWAFMDAKIESSSNKALAKAHIDFLGSWLQKTTDLSHKGVHEKVTQLESVKAVFHLYLVVADLLGYLDGKPVYPAKPSISTATMDEFEALLGVDRSTAKEIVKARGRHGFLDGELLGKVPGVNSDAVEKAEQLFKMNE